MFQGRSQPSSRFRSAPMSSAMRGVLEGFVGGGWGFVGVRNVHQNGLKLRLLVKFEFLQSDDRTYCSIVEYTCKTFLELLLSWYERTVLSEAPNEMMLPKRITTCTHSKPVPSEFLYFMRHQKSSSENSPMRKWRGKSNLNPFQVAMMVLRHRT